VGFNPIPRTRDLCGREAARIAAAGTALGPLALGCNPAPVSIFLRTALPRPRFGPDQVLTASFPFGSRNFDAAHRLDGPPNAMLGDHRVSEAGAAHAHPFLRSWVLRWRPPDAWPRERISHCPKSPSVGTHDFSAPKARMPTRMIPDPAATLAHRRAPHQIPAPLGLVGGPTPREPLHPDATERSGRSKVTQRASRQICTRCRPRRTIDPN